MTSSYNIMEGVEEDCKELIVKFVGKRLYDFKSFLDIWNEMGFNHIYSGRPTVAETKYFTREILLIAKKFALSTFSKWDRAGGIYLLHLLYMTQPLQKNIRIRIELDEWVRLRKTADELGDFSKEVTYCFYKLFLERAFDFVFTSIAFTRERRKEEAKEVTQGKKIIQEKQNDDRTRFQHVLKKIDFDLEKYLNDENTLNMAKLNLNKFLSIDEERFEPNDLLKPILMPVEIPPCKSSKKIKILQEMTRKKRIPKYLRSVVDDSQTEENKLSSLTLPVIGDEFDEPQLEL